MAKKITKVELVNFLRGKLMTDPVWAKAALVRIFENQTDDEQASKETTHCNKIGFTACDARILTSFAQFYQKHGFKVNNIRSDRFVFKAVRTAYTEGGYATEKIEVPVEE